MTKEQILERMREGLERIQTEAYEGALFPGGPQSMSYHEHVRRSRTYFGRISTIARQLLERMEDHE